MNGVHDMGGMPGFGPVVPDDAAPWHSDWERRVFAMTLAASGVLHGNIDRRRYELEMLPSPDYLRGYFQRWYTRLLNGGVAAGIIGEPERAAIERGESVAAARDHEPRPAEVLMRRVAAGAPSLREVEFEPIFAPEDAVRARNVNPVTHTRLPRYVRGKEGVVVAYRGAHVFPDSNAERLVEDPRHLYAVRFAATTLWGPDAGVRDGVTLDLWEPYLEASA